MAIIKISEDIPQSCYSPVVRKYSAKKLYCYTEFVLSIPLDQIRFTLSVAEPDKTFPLRFQSEDIMPQLDALSDSFFSIFYLGGLIMADMHFDRYGRFGMYFIVTDSSGKSHYIEDFELQQAETDYFLDKVKECAEANGIALPFQSFSWHDRMERELDDVLDAYIEDIPIDVYRLMQKLVRDEVLEALEADEEQRKTDSMDGGLAAKYFWEAVSKKLTAS